MPQRFLPLLVVLLPLIGGAEPSSKYNVPGQARTRTCAAMKGDKIPLRFADGTPTGFYARADDPSQLAEDKRPCPAGSLELDAQEIITTGGGMKLLFHPGGGFYKDAVENGQYGHVALDDLKAPPKPKPQNLNGKPAPLLPGAVYLITPTLIPHDMFYKPNADAEGRTGSTYYTYGNPGYDKTGRRGDWTYINWSWVQNGNGSDFPANKVGGGGIVRALAKRGQRFTACDVPAVIGYSWGPDNQINGRVTAFYGKTTAGPGEKGSDIYGWLPHSYQKTGDIIVPCVRRAPRRNPPPGAKPSKDPDRMVRMATNLLSEMPIDPARRGELLKQLSAEPDAAARMELLTDLSRMDDAETVAAMLKLLTDEKDARVREQAKVLVGFMRSGVAPQPPATQPRKD